MSFNAPELPRGFFQPGLAAGAVIEAGQMVALNAAGNAVPASDAANLRVIGRAEEDVDNTGGAAGDLTVLVKRGIFRWDNSATAAVTDALIGLPAYVEDATTVAAASGPTNDIEAGLVIRIDAEGVWIDTTLAPAF